MATSSCSRLVNTTGKLGKLPQRPKSTFGKYWFPILIVTSTSACTLVLTSDMDGVVSLFQLCFSSKQIPRIALTARTTLTVGCYDDDDEMAVAAAVDPPSLPRPVMAKPAMPSRFLSALLSRLGAP